MTAKELEKRVAFLEAELAEVKRQLPIPQQPPAEKKDLVEAAWGLFAGDPAFLEAMKFGREYRESLRPKPKSKSRRRSAHAGSRH